MDLGGSIARHAGNAVRNAFTMASAYTFAAPFADYTASTAQLSARSNHGFDIRASGLGANGDFNATSVLARRQQFKVQAIATTFSSISILAASCAIYWFCMMRRNFRRDLILLLICGDFWKSMWFLIFSTTTLSRGHISTDTSLCQASGYFISVGVISCDIAILFMSLHMSLQIFPPKDSFLGHDGLYRIRYYVFAAWLLWPMTMSSLAFINARSGYISQGGFCSLPIRPFWYRLALWWIPRYLIWIYVMWVAIRIYLHVGGEFKVFGEVGDQSSSVGVPGTSQLHTQDTSGAVPMQCTQSSQSDAAVAEKAGGYDDIAPDDNTMFASTLHEPTPPGSSHAILSNTTRRPSAQSWAVPFGNTDTDHMEIFAAPGYTSPRSKSNPSSRRGSKQIGNGMSEEDFAPPPPIALDRHRGSVSTVGSMKSTGVHSSYDQPTPTLAPITEHNTASTQSTVINSADRALKLRRKAIQRQLRLLFIYPVVYILTWIIPFVAHCLNYSSYFAQHPVFAISALAVFFQCSMGFCDVAIFCWREKPWRHIPGSDGTFTGSFCFWDYLFEEHWLEQRRKSKAPDNRGLRDHGEKDNSRSKLVDSLKRWSMSIAGKTASSRSSDASTNVPASVAPAARRGAPPLHRRTRSGGSDRRFLHAERAQERLALERADWARNRNSLQERRTSVLSAQIQEQQTPPYRREWWDRQMSIGDDLNDDLTP